MQKDFGVSFSKLSFFLVIAFFADLGRAFAQTDRRDPLVTTVQLNPLEWNVGQAGTIEIKMTLPEKFHVYAESIKLQILEPDGFQMSTPQLSPQTEWFDKFSKRKRQGFVGTAILKAHLEAPSRFSHAVKNMKLELSYQACSDQFCLFPTVKKLEAPLQLRGTFEKEKEFPASSTVTPSSPSFLSTQNFSQYLGDSLALGLVFVFLAGILTSFTPCIFPMIPITLAVLGNHSEQRTRLQNFLISLFYVFGIATTYSLLGLVAASSGTLFGASLGNPYVLSVMCVIFLTMALSMYGLFELQVPAFIRNKWGTGKNKGGYGGAYVTGLLAGVVASPCVGPVLVAILTFVATSQSRLLGFLYLFTYAMGLGMIFLVLGLSNQFIKLLPRSGMWMNIFKFFLGTLMLSAFYYYLNLLFPDRWFDFAFGLGLVAIASIYGAFLPSIGKTPLQHLRKGLMLAVLITGFGYIILSAFDLRPYLQQKMISGAGINELKKLNWQPYSEQALEDSAQDKKPVIIDFWAEWCAACHELEENTFSDLRVRALATNYTLLKFDATSDSPALKDLKKRYMIQGLPTIIFISKQGEWQKELTLTEFEKPEKFTERMEKGL